MLPYFLRTSASSITWQACLPRCRPGSVSLLWECDYCSSRIERWITHCTQLVAPVRWHIHAQALTVKFFQSPYHLLHASIVLTKEHSNSSKARARSSGVQSGDIRMCSRHIFACRVCAPRTHAASRTLRLQMLKVHSAQAYLSSIARPVAVSKHWVCIARRPLASPIKAAQGSGSYDSDSDELLREFQRYADPNKLQNATKRLELTWGVQRVGLLLVQNGLYDTLA